MRTPTVLAFVVLFLVVPIVSETQEKNRSKIPVPPLQKGGIAGLWYREHEFIQEKYGPFELLNFDNVSWRMKKGTGSDMSWRLVAMGNFLPDALQYATLARAENHPDNILLIMFEWVPPSDTTRPHGVFYHTLLSKNQLLLRTKQSESGIDTLQFSCADVQRVCGQAFYDNVSRSVRLEIVGKDTVDTVPKVKEATESDW
ncbi:MAG: hypothetical protein ACOC41_07615 [Chitinivibrionales bacterium]